MAWQRAKLCFRMLSLNSLCFCLADLTAADEADVAGQFHLHSKSQSCDRTLSHLAASGDVQFVTLWFFAHLSM